jgi:hypothetical protein
MKRLFKVWRNFTAWLSKRKARPGVLGVNVARDHNETEENLIVAPVVPILAAVGTLAGIGLSTKSSPKINLPAAAPQRNPIPAATPQEQPPSAEPRAEAAKLEADVAAANAEAAASARRKRGRRASILTSPLGASQPPSNVRKTTLGSL